MKRAIWRREDEISPLHLYTMDNAELSNADRRTEGMLTREWKPSLQLG